MSASYKSREPNSGSHATFDGESTGEGCSSSRRIPRLVESVPGANRIRKSQGSKLLSETLGLYEGDEVGRFLLLSTLGAGAMGMVFRAYDPDLDRQIALKFIQVGSSPGTTVQRSSIAQSRLIQEDQAMAQVVHPNVVGINDVGTFGGHVYLAMELIEGRTMKE